MRWVINSDNELCGLVETMPCLKLLNLIPSGNLFAIFRIKNSSSPDAICALPSYPSTSLKVSFRNARLAPLHMVGTPYAIEAAPDPIKLENSIDCMFEKIELSGSIFTEPKTIFTFSSTNIALMDLSQSAPTRQSASTVTITFPVACFTPSVMAAFLPNFAG